MTLSHPVTLSPCHPFTLSHLVIIKSGHNMAVDDELFINTDSRILLMGVERAGVRVALAEPVAGEHRLVGWLGVARNPALSMVEQVADSCRRLGQRLGCVLWDDEEDAPFVRAIDPVRYPPVQQIVGAASPRAPLRIFLAGLSEQISMAAAETALVSAPTQIVGSIANADLYDVAQLAHTLSECQPEAMVVVGGYDSAPPAVQRPMLSLCRNLGQALDRLPRSLRPFIVYAGNQSIAETAASYLRLANNATPLAVVDNVMPSPSQINPVPIANTLTDYHWRACHRITGFREVAGWVTSPGQINSLETSFIQFVTMWAGFHGLPVLHGLYTTPDLWLHVWANADGRATQLVYTAPGGLPDLLLSWPPLQLVCGDWPTDDWAVPAVAWWDRTGLTPLVATLGQIDPLAMMQIVQRDLMRSA